MFVWLPSLLAFAAVLFALLAGPSGPVALEEIAGTAPESTPLPLAIPAFDGRANVAVTAPAPAPAPEPEDDAEADVLEDEAGPPVLSSLSLDVWPLAVRGGHLDGVAPQGERLVVATQDPAPRPIVDPAILRVTALAPTGAPLGAPWEAAVLGPSPMGLAASGAQVLVAWNHRAHPGRELALLRVGEVASAASLEIAPPPEDGHAFTPSGAPLVAASSDGGWVVCTGTTEAVAQCAHVDTAGAVRWNAVRALKGAAPWRLVPVGDGFQLYALSGSADEATPQVVFQALDSTGAARGRSRVLARMQRHRALGVAPLGDAGLLFGRRAGAKASTALLVTSRRAVEQDKRWNRTVGGLAAEGGALLVELDKLHMEEGRPISGFRPRRFAVDGGREKPEAWPEAVTAHLPKALEQQLVVGAEALAFVDPPRDGVLYGVALRPRPAGREGVAEANGRAAHP